MVAVPQNWDDENHNPNALARDLAFWCCPSLTHSGYDSDVASFRHPTTKPWLAPKRLTLKLLFRINQQTVKTFVFASVPETLDEFRDFIG